MTDSDVVARRSHLPHTEGIMTVHCQDCNDLLDVAWTIVARKGRAHYVLHDQQYEVMVTGGQPRVLHVTSRGRGGTQGSVPTYAGYAGDVIVLQYATTSVSAEERAAEQRAAASRARARM